MFDTTTSAGPGVPAGVRIESWTDDTKVTVAAAPPTVTVSLAVKLVPVTVTVVPPDGGPLVGKIDVIDGGLL